MRRPITLPSAAVAGLLLTLTACGSAASSSEAAITASPVSATATTESGTVIKVSIGATTVSANPQQVAVGLNQPVTLLITAARAGELHVHSTPEKHIEYPAGRSTVPLAFNIPGTVVIEDHALDQQVAQVKVN